jgi:hypothetical protein
MARKYNNNKVDLALMAQDIKYIQKDVADIKRRMEADYVTREEFDPIKKIVYGIIGLLLTGLVAALMRFLLIK